MILLTETVVAVKIDYAFRNHIGLLRPRNEDAWYTGLGGSAHEDGVFAVADGMGGHPGGEVASALAIAAVADGRDLPREPAPPERLLRIFRAASEKIRERGRHEPQHRDMGTTLTVALLDHGLAWIGHIGDCRLYWIRGGEEVQITRDHTMAQDLIEAGLLHPSMADNHPSSHVLTRCLGACPDQGPDLLLSPLALAAGDRLLLASDGLVKAVRAAALPELLQGRDPEAGVEQLISAALEGGAPDNVTVVLLSLVGSADPAGETAGGVGVEFESVNALRWTRG